MRAADLGIELIRQGIPEKLAAVKQILAELGLKWRQVCYLGDDLPDLPVVRAAGLGVAVADACVELRQAAHYVTTAPGGGGAVREVVELILRSQHRWEDVIQTTDDHMPRFAHIAGSFVVVFATYWTYVLLAVPLIEPSAPGAGDSAKPIGPIPSRRSPSRSGGISFRRRLGSERSKGPGERPDQGS